MPKRGLVWWPVVAAVLPAYLLFKGVSAPGGYYLTLSAAFVAWFAYHHPGRADDPTDSEPRGLDLGRFGERVET